jgi:HEAT repeat protein
MNRVYRSFVPFLAVSIIFIAGGSIPQAVATQESLPVDVAARINELGSPNPAKRAAAACALGSMTSRALPAIPYLMALLSDGAPIESSQSCTKEAPFEDEAWAPQYDEVREPSPGEAATYALMAIGQPSLGPLQTALLQANHWRARKNAAWALAHRGRPSDELADQFIDALNDNAWQVRAQAAYALSQRGGGRRGVVPALAGALQDPRAEVRIEAAKALWHRADGSAFNALLAALKDENREVRHWAAQALGNRAQDREVQLLISALNDADQNVRVGVKQALNVIKGRLNGEVTNLRPVQIPD